MPTNSKKSSKKKSQTKGQTIWAYSKARYHAFMQRHPHRSFRLTRRRDYIRPLALPGNISFTAEVSRTLWKFRSTFLLLGAVYSILYIVLVGVQSQDTYTAISDSLEGAGSELFSGNWGILEQVGATLLTIASGGASTEMTEAQQIFSVLVFLMVWLSVVWLLRNLLAGHKVKLRDGLYNSGAPLFSTVIVALALAVQLIPVALAFIGYSAAASSGLLESGAAAMLFWIAASLLGLLSLYWVTSSFFAMIIVTLPGMYPWRALRSASELLLGRKVKIVLRLLWLLLIVALTWVVFLIPGILLDVWLKSTWPALEWMPIIPLLTVILTALTTIWAASYVYLLYRKVVDYVPES